MLDGVRAVLIDLDGVLYVEDQPIAGARDAVGRLRASGLALRFVDQHDGALARTDASQARRARVRG